jgi:DNA-binding LacI/PurR family transcriptional regulator
VLRVQIATLERMRRGGALASFLQRAAGVVVLGHSDEWIVDEAELASALPSVLLNWDRPGEFRRQGLVEHLDRGADMALTYLAERGHRNIGLMTGPMALPRAQGLLAGTHKAAARLGLNLDPRWMVESSYAFGDARDKARAMLEQAARPTAMFTFGTQFSFGVLQAAYQLGIDVPGDLSVLSYVECKQTEYCAPRMTTVSPSIPQIAAHVVDRILALVAGAEGPVVTSLDVELIERDSVRTLNTP